MFPFQDCINRRILLWNEINFMDSAIDTIKMLCAGDTMSVNIKFKSHVALYRTPLIILTNHDRLRDPAFKDRMFAYTWNNAPFLKDYDKKPHPYAWPLLLHKYKIIALTQEQLEIFNI